LVSGAAISDFGHRVICADISKEKIRQLNNGLVPIYEPGLNELLKKNINAGRLSFTYDIKKATRDSEIIFIAVGTPEGRDGKSDISAVKSVAKVIGENINEYKVICTKSTVPVGTGDLIKSIIAEHNFNNISFDYVSNPEFLREGSAVKDFLWPDRIVIGSENNKSLNIMKEVYDPLYINDKPILSTSITTAEMIKYAANAFLALKISYINEVANLCERLGADVQDVAKAMGQDGRISSKFLHPGPGYGGSCFPKDTKAFAKLSKENGEVMHTIEASIQSNENQKIRMVKKMKTLVGGSFKDKRISILGLAFKPNTDDVRESASITMIKEIKNDGGIINAYDPVANESMRKLFEEINYFNSWEEACKDVDAVAILTEWNEFRSMSIERLSQLMSKPTLFDTRNIIDVKKLNEHKFTFDNVGRGINNIVN
jgi:UDPglucose 6-dehydrogenase